MDFSIARKGGEFVFILRYAIETFTECVFFLRFAIETATGSFFIFQEKKEIQMVDTIVNRDRFFTGHQLKETINEFGGESCSYFRGSDASFVTKSRFRQAQKKPTNCRSPYRD